MSGGRRAVDVVVRAALRRWQVGGRVAVACSGGPDSTLLAAVAVEVLGAVELVYVDHGLRAGAAVDGERVAELAAALGAGFRSVAVVVDRAQASLEDAARRARYAALDELDVDWVLLGHTASDQAETVLMRIVRGTGVAGLAGMPQRRGRYLRPMLGLWRGEVLAELAARRLTYADDPMNADDAFTRTRARRRWLPALREENPAVDEALVRLAASAGEQRAALDWAAAQLLAIATMTEVSETPVVADSPMTGVSETPVMSCAALAGAPPAVVKRALALAAPVALAAVHLDALDELVRRPDAGTVQLDLTGITAYRSYDALRFGAPVTEVSETSVTGPEGPYLVRRVEPGDRMRPARLGGRSRKLSDLYIDAKVARPLRAAARVVVRQRDGVIVWAEHIGSAHGCEIEVTLTVPYPPATKGVD